MVAEEHVAPSRSHLSFSFEVSNDDDDDDVNNDDDDDDNNNNDDDDDDDDDDVNFHLFVPPKEPVNEASTARKPLQAILITTDSPSRSDKDDLNASLLPRKRRRRYLRPGVLIVEPVQQPTSNVEPAQVIQDDQSLIVEPAQVIQDDQSPIVEPAQVHQDDQGLIVELEQVHQDVQSLIFSDDFDFLNNEETFASGSSSSPPPPKHDVASIKLSKLLSFQDSIPQSKGKGISIGSGHGGDEDSQPTISELKQEIVLLKQESIEKDLLIGILEVRVSELEKENSQKNKQI
ncbi:unnamed protein product [Lactuca virosa]|uniref:Uncharacterized protein n=1 Tax=Lactuca virosa TaxID=75947 RepID=A0AAU9MN97_9ASTR|nr:unnamed protein product [Lactuca virosa]